MTEARRVAVDGRGASAPIVDNALVEGRVRNRRVEILVTRAE